MGVCSHGFVALFVTIGVLVFLETKQRIKKSEIISRDLGSFIFFFFLGGLFSVTCKATLVKLRE